MKDVIHKYNEFVITSFVKKLEPITLVEGDMDIANKLHADDFQLINPLGQALTKELYLGALASNFFDYLLWEPEKINVRVYGNVAIIRYKSRMEILLNGQKSSQRGWHTDFYEKRDGRWQVVWSQMTKIQ